MAADRRDRGRSRHREHPGGTGDKAPSTSGHPTDDVPTLWDGPPRDPEAGPAGLVAGGNGRLPLPGRIGPYHLVRRLGEGGMGEVWLAEQHEPVRRQVALKVIKRGMDTRRVLARFQAELQALALMDHPAIATVLEAGETERGRPYFVMEYVRGVSITEYCDRHRLDLVQRLELFRQVCEGVQHAHQKALIHRDLKPSNILVTEHQGRPMPKIIDFGVAKATAQRLTDSTLYTELGQFIGTPEFMSPEQAEATGEDVDTRSDVYSLGVVLYALLTGTLPFSGRELRSQGAEGIRRMIREVEPQRPSQRVRHLEDGDEAAARLRSERSHLSRKLAGELDWIVMKTLDKDRNRRYGSPQELSADLGRYLRDEPVEAGPPSTAYRVHKFVRRHRAGVAAAATLLVLLLSFAIATSLQARRLAEERDEKERALAEAEAVTAFLSDMLGEADPGRSGHDVTVREVLDTATQRLDTSLPEQPAVEARLRLAIGSAYRSLGFYDDAEAQIRDAFLARRTLLGPSDPATLTARFHLANVAYNQGRHDEAELLYREVLEERRRVLGPDHKDTLLSLGNLGLNLAAQERYEEAVPLLMEASEGCRRVMGIDEPQTLWLVNNLAAIHHMRQDLEAAEPLYRDVLSALERTVGPQAGNTLKARHNLGELYRDQGRWELAEPLLLEVVEQKRRVFGADHPSTLYTVTILAGLYEAQDRLDKAEPLLLEAWERRRERLGPEHASTLDSSLAVARVQRRQGRRQEVEQRLDEILERAREKEDGAPLAARALHGLACLRASTGDAPQALELLRQALTEAGGEDLDLDDPDLDSLRESPEFQALVAAWSGRSRGFEDAGG